MIERITYKSYDSGHPWYYLLGGPVLKPRDILHSTITRGYRGWMETEIVAADNKAEPERSSILRLMRKHAYEHYKSDICRYRQLAYAITERRRKHGLIQRDDSGAFLLDESDTAISLKHNHLYNDFAHLTLIDHLLARQPDLFA